MLGPEDVDVNVDCLVAFSSSGRCELQRGCRCVEFNYPNWNSAKTQLNNPNLAKSTRGLLIVGK